MSTVPLWRARWTRVWRLKAKPQSRDGAVRNVRVTSLRVIGSDAAAVLERGGVSHSMAPSEAEDGHRTSESFWPCNRSCPDWASCYARRQAREPASSQHSLPRSAASIFSDCSSGTSGSLSPCINRKGASSAVTLLTGEASRIHPLPVCPRRCRPEIVVGKHITPIK